LFLNDLQIYNNSLKLKMSQEKNIKNTAKLRIERLEIRNVNR